MCLLFIVRSGIGSVANCNCRGTREIDLLQIFFANPHSGETHTLRVCCRSLFEKETRRPRYVESFYVPKFRFRNTFSGFAARDEQVTQVAYSFSIARNLPFLFLSASSLSLSLDLLRFGDFFSLSLTFEFPTRPFSCLYSLFLHFSENELQTRYNRRSYASYLLSFSSPFSFFSLSLSLPFLFSFFWKGRSAKISSIG